MRSDTWVPATSIASESSYTCFACKLAAAALVHGCTSVGIVSGATSEDGRSRDAYL